MTSLHRLIAIAVVWVACGGALVVLFQSLFLSHMPVGYALAISAMLTAAASFATFSIARADGPGQ